MKAKPHGPLRRMGQRSTAERPRRWTSPEHSPMIFETLFDNLARGTGLVELRIFGRSTDREGAEHDWTVLFTGVAFWVVLGALVFLFLK